MKITVARDKGWVGKFATAYVLVDGAKIGSLREGERLSVTVGPGQHNLQVVMQGVMKTARLFFIMSDTDVNFTCRTKGLLYGLFLVPLFVPGLCFDLRQVR